MEVKVKEAQDITDWQDIHMNAKEDPRKKGKPQIREPVEKHQKQHSPDHSFPHPNFKTFTSELEP